MSIVIEGLVIRRATTEDVEVMAGIRKEAWLSAEVSEKEGITREDVELMDLTGGEAVEDLRRWVVRDPGLRLPEVAEIEGKIVGFCLSQKDMTPKQNLIYLLYVATAYQGRGIGKELFTRAIDWLGNDKEIVLAVMRNNTRAIRLYERFGFTFFSGNYPIILPNKKEVHNITMTRPGSD